MNIILFDDKNWQSLLPLTFTRPVGDLRVGILKIAEKWALRLKTKHVSFLTQSHLSEKFPAHLSSDNYFINGGLLPDKEIIAAIKNLETDQVLFYNETVLAFRSEKAIDVTKIIGKKIAYQGKVTVLERPWDIFTVNAAEIEKDFTEITAGRKSAPLSKTNNIIASENVFLEEGASVECSILNASGGPIYIGKDAEVLEGAMIRGPFALGEHAQIKMGAKIYTGTTVGPHCKVGGEVSNSVIQGYSNKGHDGFLGNSVLGEWCNLGADTNNSNLKNNYSKVKVWSFLEEDYINTGLQFCGLIMGDHSKCSINTMFNTGTVVGVSANIFGNGFPPKFVPSFAWGGSEGFKTYRLEEAFEVATRVMERRNILFDEKEKKMMSSLFDDSTKYRSW